MTAFLQALASLIQRHRLILPGSTLVVGVSGGADSLALLHALNQLSAPLNFRLRAATLDHGLRGEAGAEDARFVEQTALSWGIPVTAGQADVKALAEQRNLSIEAAARLARYEFLASAAGAVGAGKIAVAHHADDQAETVLMHLLRGSGTQGLVGMTLESPLPGHTEMILIRPFLHFTRAEIAAYVQEQGLQPRHDATNDDPFYLRNRIRLETLPYLENLNPQIRRALTQLADIAAAEQSYVEEQFRQTVVEPHVQLADGQARIPRAVFRALHPALQRRFIAWAVQQIRSADGDTGYPHIIAAVEIGLNGRQGTLALLADGLRLRVDYDTLMVEREDAPLKTNMALLAADQEIQVAIPGLTALPGHWQLQATCEPLIDSESGRLAISEGSAVSLRTRRPGDRFAPLGLQGHTQKLPKWMIDHKLPAALRERIPLLVVNGQIAALITPDGWIVDEHFAVQESTARIIYFTIRQVF